MSPVQPQQAHACPPPPHPAPDTLHGCIVSVHSTCHPYVCIEYIKWLGAGALHGSYLLLPLPQPQSPLLLLLSLGTVATSFAAWPCLAASPFRASSMVLVASRFILILRCLSSSVSTGSTGCTFTG
jgi:hypothetical protein